jgi:hypothetical protein
MTAINVIVTAKCGYMVSDSLCYDLAGNVTGFAAKVQTLPHAHSVVAARGLVGQWQWATELLGRLISFDLIESIGPKGLRLHWPEMQEEFGDAAVMEIAVMGWSHALKCVRAIICKSPEFAFESGSPILAPVLTPKECGEAGIELTDNPPRDLLRIIKAQRLFCSGREENGRIHVIGGAVILTTLTDQKIEQRAIAALPITAAGD